VVGIKLALTGHAVVHWDFGDGCILDIAGQDRRPGYRISLPAGEITVTCPHGLTLTTPDLGPASQRPA